MDLASGDLIKDKATVKVTYKGTLEDGTVFDQNDEGFEFEVGVGKVIKCWDKGIVLMREGQTAILECPPSFAYGEAGIEGAIPPNAVLTFEVKILEWTPSDALVKEDYMERDYYMPGYVSQKAKKEYPPHIAMFKDYIETIGDF
jgi:hypothetical protein